MNSRFLYRMGAVGSGICTSRQGLLAWFFFVAWLLAAGTPVLAEDFPPAETLGTIKSVVTTPVEDLSSRPDGLGLSPENDLLLARQRALSLAGAFANDGYRLRDGSWSLYLSENQPALMAIWLFARNGVWFSAATADKGASPKLEIFGPEGQPVPTLEYHAPGQTAVGFMVPLTGLYYIRASFPGPLTPFCLVTSYK